MLISRITLGDRVRKDLGDVQGLADSIKRTGLLHPVVVTRDNLLVAGHRRIEAARLLGWSDIAVTVVDVADLLAAERDENSERKDFTRTEAVAIGRLIEDAHRTKIAASKHDNAVRAGKLRHGISDTPKKEAAGSTDSVVAEAVGLSASSYAKARAVVAAAEAEPERFGDLPALMDETGNVSGTHREMERRKGAPERHPVHRKAHRRDQTKEMERALWQLEAAVKVIASIEPQDTDPARRVEWADALREVRSTLGRAVKGLTDGKA